jgi:hypothetical protein
MALMRSSSLQVPLDDAAAHFFGGAATGSTAYVQCAGSSELVPCTLAAVAMPPWDVARALTQFLKTFFIHDAVALCLLVLRISRRLAACTLSSQVPPLGASVVATGYGLLPAGCCQLHMAAPCCFCLTARYQALAAAHCSVPESFRIFCASKQLRTRMKGKSCQLCS